jgi:hypothetical protein
MPMYARISADINPGLHPLPSFYSNAKHLVHSRKHGAIPEKISYIKQRLRHGREIFSTEATECGLVDRSDA